MNRQPRIAIIGSGMSGICMAIALHRNGFEDVTIYEKAQRGGGTWRDNTYPGLTCDVPSRFYQFSFAPNPGWTSFFSPGAEIFDYFDRVARQWGLPARTRFGTEVTGAEYLAGRWQLTTAAGDQDTYDFLICATGILHRPQIPKLPGIETFAGSVCHSARWDDDLDLTGKRVGIVGTGSTGVQIVTALAGKADHVILFQRTAQWILPMPNFRYSGAVAALYRHVPALNQIAYRGTRAAFEWISDALIGPGWKRRFVETLCKRHLRRIADRALRATLTPDYQPMCKRLVISSGFYSAVQRHDVDVVASGIDRIEPGGILTEDGQFHELDVLVLATGFDAHAFMRPMELTGRDGRTVDQAWSEGPRAHRTVAMPGFPNLFMMMGPHSPVGNYSLTAIAETQATHIAQWIGLWRAGDFDVIEPTTEATEQFNAQIRSALPRTVWASGCDSWYLGKDGVPELWPWNPRRYRAMLMQPDRSEYRMEFIVPAVRR